MRLIGLLLISICTGWSQAGDAGLSFEVASIKAAPKPDPGKPMYFGCRGGPGDKQDPGRWRCQNQTVSNLISLAYNLKRWQMTDQPGLFDAAMFDIDAKVPEGITREQMREMQRNLLKERFKLAVHFEKKDTSGFELVVTKGGLKIKEAEPRKANPDGAVPLPTISSRNLDKNGFPIVPRGASGMIMMNGKAGWGAPEATMEDIANMIGTQLNRPVVDGTGLPGKYEVTLTWATDNMRRPAATGPDAGADALIADAESGPTLTSAIQEQLGLKLQAKKIAVDVLVIDHVEKTPTEN